MPPFDKQDSVNLLGPLPPGLEQALDDAGLPPNDGTAASILVTTGITAVSTARDFADAVPAGQGALIVTLLNPTTPHNETGPQQWAFTRQAALDFAPRRIRVNAIALGADPLQPTRTPAPTAAPVPPSDIAAAIALMWRLPSMTGQLIRLGSP